MKQNRLNSFLTQACIAASLALTACGPQAFVPNTASSSQSAAGGMNIPPKIDIVLGMSSNGTMRNIYPGITSELPAFLTNLQNSGWDYRFVSIPLSQYQPTDAADFPIAGTVSVSDYDANYPIGTWLAPYPGATHASSPAILSSLMANMFFVTPLDYSDTNDDHETGFDNQLNFLERQDVQSGILRPDAMLAVITMSNADDRSDWNWNAGTGAVKLGVGTVPLTTYASEFLALKAGGSAAVKYFSVVAAPSTTCGNSDGGDWTGTRYSQMAAMLSGQSVDICTVSVANSLTAIQNNLQQYRLSFEKKYLVIGTEPNVATMTITKYAGGNAGSASTIPQDPTNGWTYIGPVPSTGIYTIDSPIAMDEVTTGYYIELHGSAKLEGLDTASVNYVNAGSVSSH
jgi:hypothetical protein